MRWVLLLRAVNLGARNQVAMGDLRALLEALGYGDVRTALQSGNAVFTTARRRSPRALETEIGSRLERDLGLDVTVLVRTAAELAAVVTGNPFDGVDPKQLQVAFLSEAPPEAKLHAVDPTAWAPDELAFGDRAVYLRLPHSFQGSRLPDLEKLLGVRVTVRTWNTVRRLHDLAGGATP